MNFDLFFDTNKSFEGSTYSSSIGLFNNDENVNYVTASDYIAETEREKDISNINHVYFVSDVNYNKYIPTDKEKTLEVYFLPGIASNHIVSLEELKTILKVNNKKMHYNTEYSINKLKKPIKNINISLEDFKGKPITGKKSSFIYLIKINPEKIKKSIENINIFDTFYIKNNNIKYIKKFKYTVNFMIR